MKKMSTLAAAGALCLVATVATAQERLVITVENLAPTTGFFLTPTWVGLHDGSFDLFDVGTAATPGLATIAETGDVSILQGEFDAPGRLQSVAADPAGFGSVGMQPPLIDTGNTATTEINIMNPAAYRYFSYASMVIPSNDAFIGNGNPLAYELFDAAGNFNGDLVIDVTGADIWDSGSEVNNTFGAAFSAIDLTGVDPADIGARENGTVQQHPGLANFEGTPTPVGLIGSGLAPGLDTPVARISISVVPEPTAAVLALLAGVGTAFRRRR